MQRTPFPLQTVHNLRVAQQEAAERELAKMVTLIAAIETKLQDLIETRQAIAAKYHSLLASGRATPQEISLTANYIETLHRNETTERSRLRGLEQERESRRRVTEQAARQAKITDTLRERHQIRVRNEHARQEQLRLDEMATLAFAQRVH